MKWKTMLVGIAAISSIMAVNTHGLAFADPQHCDTEVHFRSGNEISISTLSVYGESSGQNASLRSVYPFEPVLGVAYSGCSLMYNLISLTVRSLLSTNVIFTIH